MAANNVEISEIPTTPWVGPFRLLWGAAATAASVLCTLLLGVIAALAAVVGRNDVVDSLARVWAAFIIRACGIKVKIRGLENIDGLGPCVLAANHQSFFDIFSAMACIPHEVRFVAKKELLRIPLVGYCLKESEHIVIDRVSGGKAIRKALQIVKKGRLICVFAEGHRYSDNRVHEFNEGAAWLALAANVPCVPVAFSGTGAFFPRGAKIVVPGGKMLISFGKPISVAGLTAEDRPELTRRLEAAVKELFVTEV
jgi:1-acyl-sn-glycerol-3-phosphate acyltransferase